MEEGGDMVGESVNLLDLDSLSPGIFYFLCLSLQ